MKKGKGGPETELFWVACIDAGDKGTGKALEKSWGEFSTNEAGDGFVNLGRMAGAEKIAKDGKTRATTHKRREEEAWPHRNILEFAIDQDVTRGFGIGEEALVQNAEVLAHGGEAGIAAETLRATFDEEAFALNGLDDAAGAGSCLEYERRNTGFLKSVRGSETRDSRADNECLDLGRHDRCTVLSYKFSVRRAKKRSEGNARLSVRAN